MHRSGTQLQFWHFYKSGRSLSHGQRGYAIRFKHGITLEGAIGMTEINIQQLSEGLNHLQQLRERLLAGSLSPEGAWIHEYEVRRTYPSGNTETYGYAKWQAHEPIFKRNPKKQGRSPRAGKDPEFTCHQHIGRVWSTTGLGMEPEVEAAYQEWRNRKKLEAIERALGEIQAILVKFEKTKVEGDGEGTEDESK